MPMAWKEEMKSVEMPKQRKGNPNLGMILTEYVQKEASFFFFFLAAQALHWHMIFPSCDVQL